jgi:probable HAF family extracellular repeat protein
LAKPDTFLTGEGTAAFGINDMGQIVGQFTDSKERLHGFLLSGGTYFTIDDPLGVDVSFASGINGSGQIVGDTTTPAANTAS